MQKVSEVQTVEVKLPSGDTISLAVLQESDTGLFFALDASYIEQEVAAIHSPYGHRETCWVEDSEISKTLDQEESTDVFEVELYGYSDINEARDNLVLWVLGASKESVLLALKKFNGLIVGEPKPIGYEVAPTHSDGNIDLSDNSSADAIEQCVMAKYEAVKDDPLIMSKVAQALLTSQSASSTRLIQSN